PGRHAARRRRPRVERGLRHLGNQRREPARAFASGAQQAQSRGRQGHGSEGAGRGCVMSCASYAASIAGCDTAFTVDASRVTFGRGCLAELGPRVAKRGLKRVALFTDARVRQLPFYAVAHGSLVTSGIDVVVFDEVHIEPTDASFAEAARFV